MSGTHVLVIDDSQTVRKLVEISLRSTRLTADFASSGAEGIVFARRTTPDVILLDFVLPDMRGTEVCAQLTRDPRTAQIPVVLMTAKGENVRDLFTAFPQVHGYVAKPFTPATIVEAVSTALQRRAAPAIEPPRATASPFSFAQKEIAASKLYSRLKASFASIPRWAAEIGPEPPAPFFARKILSPEVVDDLLGTLMPFYRKAIAEEEARLLSAPPSAGGGGFQGTVESWPLRDIVTMFGASGRCGELTLTIDDRSMLVYFRGGEVVLITTRDPHDYVRGCTVDLRGVSPAVLERARSEQRTSGKPLHITVAEAGELLDIDLTATVHGRSRRLLFEALEARAGRFRWRDIETFPEWVEAYGRHVSLVRERNTLMFGPPDSNPPPASSLSQLTLERLRVQQTSELYANAPRPRGEAVYARTQGFSTRLPQFSINADERRVLSAIDGNRTVEGIVATSGMLTEDVSAVVHRLATVGLLYPKLPGSEASPSSDPRIRPVMILEPDVEGFQRPLESLLRGRAEPIELMSLEAESDVVAAVKRERPRLVILNVGAAAADVRLTAKAIREEEDLADVPLVAVLDSDGAAPIDELSSVGFSAVLVKPILYSDLERLLA